MLLRQSVLIHISEPIVLLLNPIKIFTIFVFSLTKPVVMKFLQNQLNCCRDVLSWNKRSEFQLLLLYKVPSSRAEHRSFRQEQPEGAPQGSGAAAEGDGSPFCRPLPKARSAGVLATVGWLFFWILFFGQTKKSIAAVGPRTHSQISHRAAIPYRNLQACDVRNSAGISFGHSSLHAAR